MYKFIFIITILVSLPALSFAAPYKCNRLGVFDDITVCNSYCSRPCDELTSKGTGNTCDISKYQSFIYINDKTYAITKSPVEWDKENTAEIRNDTENQIISSILKSTGITEAWIGIYDPSQSSTAYGVVDFERFKTTSGRTPKYTNWQNGEPNNALNSGAIGNSPLYGEYWAVIDQNGNWNDIGLSNDGQTQLRHAVVEWNGELSCVAGIENTISDGKPSGMVCGKEDDNLGFNFQSCTEGGIFGGGSGFLCPIEKTACNRNENEIIKDEHIKTALTFPSHSEYRVKNPKPPYTQMETNFVFNCYEDTNGMSFTSSIGEYSSLYYDTNISNINGTVTITITGYQIVTPSSFACGDAKRLNYLPYVKSYPIAEAKEIVSSILTFKSDKTYTLKEGESTHVLPNDLIGFTDINNVNYSATIRNRSKEITYSCPHSGKACIDSGNGYFCSPNDCTDGSSGGSYESNTDETPEGANDADNNGATDEEGNCLGIIKIFPGRDARCRLPGTQSKFIQCCKLLNPDEVDKPDIVIFPDALDFKVCNGSERQLAVNRAKDMCVEVGKYCAEKWQGSGCVQYKKTYCCFDSDFSRAYSEAGMEMLGKTWGTPESPFCGGFSTEEMQYLTGAGISNHPKLKEYGEKLGREFSDKLTNEFEKNFDKNTIGNQMQDQIEGLKK